LLGKNYYLVPHYPARDFGFAIGIWWRFYDWEKTMNWWNMNYELWMINYELWMIKR
jgi:hypothetical protein